MSSDSLPEKELRTMEGVLYDETWLYNKAEVESVCNAVKLFIEQFTPDYKQDFPSKKAVFKADAQTELIAKMLKVLT